MQHLRSTQRLPPTPFFGNPDQPIDPCPAPSLGRSCVAAGVAASSTAPVASEHGEERGVLRWFRQRCGCQCGSEFWIVRPPLCNGVFCRVGRPMKPPILVAECCLQTFPVCRAVVGQTRLESIGIASCGAEGIAASIDMITRDVSSTRSWSDRPMRGFVQFAVSCCRTLPHKWCLCVHCP